MRKFFAVVLLMTSSIIIAQENYTEAGLRLTLQKLSQKGTSGITYLNEANVITPLNIISNENPGPGISGFYNWLFAYNRLLLCAGGEIGTKNLYAEISDYNKYTSFIKETKRRIYIEKFVIGIPLEAGFLAFKSRKGSARIFTSTGFLTDFTLRNTSEGSVPGNPDFTEKYCYNKKVNVIPYFKVRFKFAFICLAYTYSYTSKQFGNAKIKFSENSFSLILIRE